MVQQMIWIQDLYSMGMNGIQLQIILALFNLIYIMQIPKICIVLKKKYYKINNIIYHLMYKDQIRIWNGEMEKVMYILFILDIFYIIIINNNV